MSIINHLNRKVMVAPSTIFNTEVKTETVQLDVSQVVHFIIASGEGEAFTVNAQIIARDGTEESEKIILETQLNLGNKQSEKIVVDADQLAHYNSDRVYLKIENADKEIMGCILAIFTNERYRN